MAIDSALHKGAVIFQQQVENLSNGEMRVEIYPANSLGDDQYSTELLQIGIIHAAVIPTSKLANFVPSLKALDYPYLFSDKAHAYKTLDGTAGQMFNDNMQSKGMVGFGFWESGFKQLTCNNVVQNATDGEPLLKNVSVRIMASEILEQQYKTIGALPLVIPFSEIYVSLQHGITRCQENPLVSIAKMRLYEVQNELVLSNHGYLAYAFIVSQRWFSGLTEQQQQILQQAEQIARQQQRALSSQLEDDYLQEIITSGNTKLYSSSGMQEIRSKLQHLPVQESLQPIVRKIREN
ncbi:TRAP transporter substrate-binding protein [Vibrio sp.]|uniref:TRAP transporter substrate-binding protein n=1 Tax=Vibrio sp. TaxID=678 RepID=UPI003D0E7205